MLLFFWITRKTHSGNSFISSWKWNSRHRGTKYQAPVVNVRKFRLTLVLFSSVAVVSTQKHYITHHTLYAKLFTISKRLPSTDTPARILTLCSLQDYVNVKYVLNSSNITSNIYFSTCRWDASIGRSDPVLMQHTTWTHWMSAKKSKSSSRARVCVYVYAGATDIPLH